MTLIFQHYWLQTPVPRLKRQCASLRKGVAEMHCTFPGDKWTLTPIVYPPGHVTALKSDRWQRQRWNWASLLSFGHRLPSKREVTTRVLPHLPLDTIHMTRPWWCRCRRELPAKCQACISAFSFPTESYLQGESCHVLTLCARSLSACPLSMCKLFTISLQRPFECRGVWFQPKGKHSYMDNCASVSISSG